MKGDPTYKFHASGSTAASADTAHALLGSYEGLSQLNDEEALHLQIFASSQNLKVYPSEAASPSHHGFRMVSGESYYVDLPPMRVGDASQLVFANDTSGNNAHVKWVVWFRQPSQNR